MGNWNFLLVAAGELFTPQTAAYALATLGLAVHFGYTGLLNFGQAGFMAVGGYAFAISASAFGLPFWACVLAAVMGSTILALLLGIPTLRLRADYLSIVTIGTAEIVRLVVRSPELEPWTGGSTGINRSGADFFAANPLPDDFSWTMGTIRYDADAIWVRLVAWTVVLLAALFIWRLMNSPWGRVVKGIRENEDAVRALGKNVFSYKMQVLVIGGVLAGVGTIFAIMPTSLQPDNYGTQTTSFLWAILLLGGAATVMGPIIGSMIFWSLLALTDGFVSLGVNSGVLPITTLQSGQVRYMLVGLALMLLVVFRPQGIFGRKSEVKFNA